MFRGISWEREKGYCTRGSRREGDTVVDPSIDLSSASSHGLRRHRDWWILSIASSSPYPSDNRMRWHSSRSDDVWKRRNTVIHNQSSIALPPTVTLSLPYLAARCSSFSSSFSASNCSASLGTQIVTCQFACPSRYAIWNIDWLGYRTPLILQLVIDQ